MDAKKEKEWLEIHDDEVTAVSLITEIESRVAERRKQHGRIHPQFPTFGQTATLPKSPSSLNVSALYHHLKQLNELEGPPVTAVLSPSPATQMPVIGRLWQLIRQQAHNLVLFYVNRANTYNYQTHSQLINALNELVRLTQKQQEEIDRLKTEIETLQNKD
ncbi:MAG: hypothetical protein H6667_19715 [Ardenticatenaceae bacterium]|nr:hypothetical protein [Ardenticatenaceae bacterium]